MHNNLGPYSVNMNFSSSARMFPVVPLNLAIMAIILYNDVHRDLSIVHAQLNHNASCSSCVACWWFVLSSLYECMVSWHPLGGVYYVVLW